MTQQDQEYMDELDACIGRMDIDIEEYEEENEEEINPPQVTIDQMMRNRESLVGSLVMWRMQDARDYFLGHEKYGNVFHGLVSALRMERLTDPLSEDKNCDANGDEAKIRQLFEEFGIPLYIKGNYLLRHFIFEILKHM